MKWPILTILFFFFMAGAYINSITNHEELHKIIFEEYNINSSITYFDGLMISPKTTPDNNSLNCNAYCELSHNINEAISYNLDPYFLMIGVGFLMIIFLIELNINNKEEWR